MRVSCDDSSDFSKYFHTDDKSSLYNYSTSHHNETLLLETTDIHNQKDHHKQGSLLGDLYEQLEVTIQQSRSASGDGMNVGEMCRHLVGALKKLQMKVERMEELDRGRQQKQSRNSDHLREVESVLSFSSKGSKCRCQERAMGNLLEYVEQRSKLDVYKQEKEALQRQVVRLEVNNQDLRKQVKKLEGENMKVKELLKQYQQLNRKQNRTEYQDMTSLDNHRSTHSRTTTLDQILAADYLKLQRQAEKENFKQMFERKIRQEEQRGQFHSPPMTPNPLLRTIKHNLHTTNNKSPPLRVHLNSRFQKLMDLDHQKTESKSKDGKLLPLLTNSRSPREHRHDMLEQEDYQIGGKNILQQVQTMTSLPQSSPPFFELKRIHSSRSQLCSPEPLSPLRPLQKGRR